tara:strand:- start:2896 stop:3627 length:732 start_codon:yes stop_codon:yes gene_type:complete
MINSLSIIFPCYNEEYRLKDTIKDLEKFCKKKKFKKVEIIFVDDGSTDSTYKILKNIKKQNILLKSKIKVLSYVQNRGKGYALKYGVKFAKYDWILTIDTDISVSTLQIFDWIKKYKISKNYKIYFGSRNIIGSNIKYQLHRKLIGLIFIGIIKILFNINLFDTQCGFKLYNKTVAKKIFSNLQCMGFSHDIEIVLLAKKFNFKIKELPVKWIHKKGSKVFLIKDSINMLISIIEIKLRFILK